MVSFVLRVRGGFDLQLFGRKQPAGGLISLNIPARPNLKDSAVLRSIAAEVVLRDPLFHSEKVTLKLNKSLEQPRYLLDDGVTTLALGRVIDYCRVLTSRSENPDLIWRDAVYGITRKEAVRILVEDIAGKKLEGRNLSSMVKIDVAPGADINDPMQVKIILEEIIAKDPNLSGDHKKFTTNVALGSSYLLSDGKTILHSKTITKHWQKKLAVEGNPTIKWEGTVRHLIENIMGRVLVEIAGLIQLEIGPQPDLDDPEVVKKLIDEISEKDPIVAEDFTKRGVRKHLFGARFLLDDGRTVLPFSHILNHYVLKIAREKDPDLKWDEARRRISLTDAMGHVVENIGGKIFFDTAGLIRINIMSNPNLDDIQTVRNIVAEIVNNDSRYSGDYSKLSASSFVVETRYLLTGEKDTISLTQILNHYKVKFARRKNAKIGWTEACKSIGNREILKYIIEDICGKKLEFARSVSPELVVQFESLWSQHDLAAIQEFFKDAPHELSTLLMELFPDRFSPQQLAELTRVKIQVLPEEGLVAGGGGGEGSPPVFTGIETAIRNPVLARLPQDIISQRLIRVIYPQMVAGRDATMAWLERQYAELPESEVRGAVFNTWCDYHEVFDLEKGLSGMSARLRLYQLMGAKFLSENDCALLADEQGTGKTLQAITAALQVGAQKILVICPATAKANWEEEIEMHTSGCHGVANLKGLNEQKRRQLGRAQDARFVITNFDSVPELADDLNSHNFDLIIVDESHRIKNPRAQRTQAVLQLDAQRKWLLSGTPLRNLNNEELFTQLHYLAPDKFPNLRDFEYRYGNEQTGDWNLHRDMQPLMLRRTIDEVLPELPPKTIITVPIRNERYAKKRI